MAVCWLVTSTDPQKQASSQIQEVDLSERNRLINSDYTVALHLNPQDLFKKEFYLEQLSKASEIVKKSFPDTSVNFLVLSNLSDEELSAEKIKTFPHLAFFYSQGNFLKFDGRFYAPQVAAFIKRNLLQGTKKISAQLKSQAEFGELLHLKEPVVVYCGKEKSPEFESFEALARGRAFLYYHSHIQKLCDTLALIRVDKIRDLYYDEVIDYKMTEEEQMQWMLHSKKDIEEEFAKGNLDYTEMKDKIQGLKYPDTEKRTVQTLNTTLLEMHAVKEPTLFVVFKRANIFERIRCPADQAKIKATIQNLSAANFYTDTETVYDRVHEEDKRKEDYYMLITLDENSPACQSMKTLAKDLKQEKIDVKFGCLNPKSVDRFQLELMSATDFKIKEAQKEVGSEKLEVLYYFSYWNKDSQKFAPHLRPFKYRLIQPSPEDVSSFFEKIQSGEAERYYFSTNPELPRPAIPEGVAVLTSQTLSEWLETQKSSRSNTIILCSWRIDGLLPIVNSLKTSLPGFDSPSLSIGILDSRGNQVPSLLPEDSDQTVAFLYPWVKDGSVETPIRLLSVDRAEILLTAAHKYFGIDLPDDL